MRTETSKRLHRAAARLIPGGVNSPARAWSAVGGNPLFIARGYGSHITDVDGNDYIDYVCSWGPLILGHAHPAVLEAAARAMETGTSFGAPTEYENRAASLIVDGIESVAMTRFVNSGTEATMSAMRLARAATGRDMVLKFDGGYHGHDDALLVRAGSGVASQGIADSAGINSKLASDTLIAPYNDVDAVESLFAEYGRKIACVIVEPVAGNMGVVPANSEFIATLRASTSAAGALLIFDEVISGFRVAYGGAQSLYKAKPDITVLGKIIGGGFPVGAYGGSAELMSHVAPLGEMYQAGTLSGNPVAMAAGSATLELLRDSNAHADLDEKTRRLAEGMEAVFREAEVSACVNSACGMLTVFFADSPVRNMADALSSNHIAFSRFFHAMLNQGVYLPPSPFEAWFVSLAHSDEDIELTIAAARDASSSLDA